MPKKPESIARALMGGAKLLRQVRQGRYAEAADWLFAEASGPDFEGFDVVEDAFAELADAGELTTRELGRLAELQDIAIASAATDERRTAVLEMESLEIKQYDVHGREAYLLGVAVGLRLQKEA